jgi:hypothetical protein
LISSRLALTRTQHCFYENCKAEEPAGMNETCRIFSLAEFLALRLLGYRLPCVERMLVLVDATSSAPR